MPPALPGDGLDDAVVSDAARPFGVCSFPGCNRGALKYAARCIEHNPRPVPGPSSVTHIVVAADPKWVSGPERRAAPDPELLTLMLPDLSGQPDLATAVDQLLAFGRPKEGSDKYKAAWDAVKRERAIRRGVLMTEAVKADLATTDLLQHFSKIIIELLKDTIPVLCNGLNPVGIRYPLVRRAEGMVALLKPLIDRQSTCFPGVWMPATTLPPFQEPRKDTTMGGRLTHWVIAKFADPESPLGYEVRIAIAAVFEEIRPDMDSPNTRYENAEWYYPTDLSSFEMFRSHGGQEPLGWMAIPT